MILRLSAPIIFVIHRHSFSGTGLNPVPARWARGSSKVKTQARGSKDQEKGYYGFVSSFWCIFQRKLCPLLSKTPKISPAAGSSNVLLLFFVEKFQARRARSSSGAKSQARGAGLSKARRNYAGNRNEFLFDTSDQSYSSPPPC